MATIVIIYDSVTGNTERMARAIAEGIETVKDVKSILKKIGEPFSLNIIKSADGIVLGSPVHYANVTSKMRDFLRSLEEEKKASRINLEGKIGAVFGSYGWDGGIAIDVFSDVFTSLGVVIQPNITANVDQLGFPSISNKSLEYWREYGSMLSRKVKSR